MMPEFLRKNFWDVSIEDLDPQKRVKFVIERILEGGDERAIRWMFRTYRKDQIVDSLKRSRNLSQRSANFWSLFLGVDKNTVLCLSAPFQDIRKTFWPY